MPPAFRDAPILACEMQLCDAMLAGDVAALDRVLDGLVFAGLDGAVVGKQAGGAPRKAAPVGAPQPERPPRRPLRRHCRGERPDGL